MEKSIRILHVDDDPDFADLTAEFLERESDRFTVTAATDADDGLDRLAEAEFDCVVSDYDMPGASGIDFLQSIRERYPDLPFVLFTGKGSEQVASDAISAGVTDYLQKRAGSEQYELLANRIAMAVDQYRTERELERQNDLFAKAQTIASVGAWEYDIRGGESYVTLETLRIHGLSIDEDLSVEKSLSYYHPDDRDDVREAFERAIEAGQAYQLEARLVGDDGQQRWVRTRGESQSEDGEVVRVRGTIQDITDQKRREQKLERKNERLEEFAQVISHDIRNPLQVAGGHLEIAAETGDEEAFEQARQAHDRIEAIINDLLTLAQQGEEISETERVDLGEAAREAWATVDTGSAKLNVLEQCQVDGDPDRFRQLLENLFRNAVEHGGPDVTVTVGSVGLIPTTTRATSRKPDGFYVADDGPGIPDDERERVFESGYSTTETGTGFGLAIVAQIANAHGWDPKAKESRAGGARFEFVDRLATLRN